MIRATKFWQALGGTSEANTGVRWQLPDLIGVVIAAVLALILLSGCATAPRPSYVQPTCEALGGPIKYNSRDRNSRRHAGPDLAPDLAQRNHVGMNLGCPQYR